MLPRILQFVLTPIGTIAGAGLLVVSLVASFAWKQQNVGVRKQAARQEKTDVETVRRATEAARRAADPAARGLRDPNARP